MIPSWRKGVRGLLNDAHGRDKKSRYNVVSGGEMFPIEGVHSFLFSPDLRADPELIPHKQQKGDFPKRHLQFTSQDGEFAHQSQQGKWTLITNKWKFNGIRCRPGKHTKGVLDFSCKHIDFNRESIIALQIISTMEELYMSLMKEASGSKYQNLKTSAQCAYGESKCCGVLCSALEYPWRQRRVNPPWHSLTPESSSSFSRGHEGWLMNTAEIS